MPSLYELKNDYLRLLELEEEVDSEAFQDALDNLTDEINTKAESIAAVLKQMEADAKMLKDEETRLKNRRIAIENNHARLKEYLKNELEVMNIDKVKTPKFTITVRNNPVKVVIKDEDLIPADYKVPKYSIDKKVLKEALLNGEEIKGAELIQEKGVQIR